MDYTAVDRRADDLLEAGYTPQQAWRLLCQEFPDVHSSTLAERVTGAAIVAGIVI